mmetsp:Transcript_15595/g.24250  ORF Transcript_15595/g.24250 Transcript_15595/m.24250 type:complete len:240 (-) Transcript_15595:26-745(-)
MILDLGEYHYSTPVEEDRELSWRLTPEESLSDWRIVIQIIEDDMEDTEASQKITYNVHKSVLGVGPRRSEYFSRVFRNEVVIEATKSTSHIQLQDSAALAFPYMLDFMYRTNDAATEVNVTTENAVALRHLAQYFGIPSLFLSVNNFIKSDLQVWNATIYLAEAELYRDEKIISAALKYCSPLPATLFKDVTSSPFFKCASIALCVDEFKMKMKNQHFNFFSRRNVPVGTKQNRIRSYF